MKAWANVRDSDRKVLGVVTNRYKVIQNEEAFSFTDSLLGEGVRYETAGSLQGGKKVWLLARMPQDYIITGERISPYLVFSNTHDGSGAIKVALTPIRVVPSFLFLFLSCSILLRTSVLPDPPGYALRSSR